MNIKELLAHVVKSKASDLHLSSGLSPIMRVDGELESIKGEPVLQESVLIEMLKEVLTESQFARLEEVFELDLSVVIEGLSRFRLNVFHQLRGISAVFRVIPTEIISIEQLGLPDILNKLCSLPNGLVLITGPTGHGKSTTLAAMVDYINDTTAQHILTLEDPIEFVHKSKKCLVQQREIHSHTDSFADALRVALREDPDVILVGELRDIETIRLALTAAETGHLVLATLHTSSAAKSVYRIIDVFPAGEKELVRSILSESLQAIVSQVLLPKIGGGRVVAYELMICTPAIRNLIREDKVPQIYSVIQTNRKLGMKTLAQHIEELVKAKKVLPSVASKRDADSGGTATTEELEK